MIDILLVVQMIISVMLIAVILIQRTGADSLSGLSGSGGNLNVVSSRTAANFLTKTTTFLIAAFLINSIVLANLSIPDQSAITDAINDAPVNAEHVNESSDGKGKVDDKAASDSPTPTTTEESAEEKAFDKLEQDMETNKDKEAVHKADSVEEKKDDATDSPITTTPTKKVESKKEHAKKSTKSTKNNTKKKSNTKKSTNKKSSSSSKPN